MFDRLESLQVSIQRLFQIKLKEKRIRKELEERKVEGDEKKGVEEKKADFDFDRSGFDVVLYESRNSLGGNAKVTLSF